MPRLRQCLGSVWACEKFEKYLIGLEKFKLVTDHKPLVPLMNKKDLDNVPLRCQRLLMRLMRFKLTAEYAPGKTLLVADTLSRSLLAYKEDDLYTRADVECYIAAVAESINPSKLEAIKAATVANNNLQTVLKNTEGFLRVLITNLKLEDTGTYRIGVGNQSSYNVNLDVRKDPCYGEPRTMTTYRGQNISIICNYPLEFKEFSKYVYKEDSDYLVKDIRAIIEKSQKSRFLISYERSAKVLSVNISDVREVDGGVYLCGVMNRDQPVLYYSFFSEIQLHIKVPPLIIIIIISVCVCVTLIGGFTLLMVYKLRQKKTQVYAASLNVFVNIRHHYETHNGEIYNSLQGQLMAKEDAFRNGDRVLYNQARNTLNKEIRVAKRSYAKKLENQFSANDPVSVWKGLKDITNYKTPSPSTEANQQLAEDLNEFYCRFETAGLTPHAPSEHLSTQPLTPPATPLSPPPALRISEDYVRQIFLKQKKRKAPGPDGVTPACLRTCADQLAFIFSQIFNRSLELCEVPACFKRSNIIPIPKKPKITGLNDYRPVALTSVVMKLFERLVLAYLKNITGPLLDPLQFAY
ncbi:hypothetical protein QTP86_009574 [Hemibagrus guttatus]|nr:hypothetical protein QTP86_009574 [Hemibagrus guttatus]